MDFILRMDCDNSSFEDLEIEVSRLLRKVANQIEANQKSGKIIDFNGNTVGQFSFDEVKSKEDH
jgi:hypothetical protein